MERLKITEADYRIYDAEGSVSTLETLIKSAGSADVIFIGESHHDPVAHFLQAELLKAVYERYDKHTSGSREVVLSMEMFEQDIQIVLDEYLAGLITEKHFINDSRAWGNYKTDYRPLIEFAREKGIPVIAANAPRRYVNRVSGFGPDALTDISQAAKSWLPPLPYQPASPEYRKKLETFRENTAHNITKDMEKAVRKGMPKAVSAMLAKMEQKDLYFTEAQSLWDASMAFSAARVLKERPDALILNINGRFHSEQDLGIPEHLSRYCPGVRKRIVTIFPDENFPGFDPGFKHLGDFVIITDPEP